MKIILGLGNPDVEYTNTRHNVGILFVDYLSQKFSSDYGWRREKNKMVFKSSDFTLIKPLILLWMSLRIRIGVDNRTNPIPGEEYVLQKFSLEERETLNKVFEEICNKLI